MANEISALTEVAADAIDRYGITTVQLMHAGIARRVFQRVGITARPVQIVHDGVSTRAYEVSRRAVHGLSRSMAAGLRDAASGQDVRPLSRSRRGRLMVGAVNALSGDRLAERGNDLAIAMSVRKDGHDVDCTSPSLRGAFPRATAKVVVFLHGLAETEEWWERPRRTGGSRGKRSFGARLRADGGYTPVHLRYNTGLHISDNGARLSALLDELVRAWPVPVQELVLVGHSMGGLVIRSASHCCSGAGHTWPLVTRHIVTLGTPHHGAPLAKAVHAAAWALRRLPETEALGHVLDTRSAGIRDLRWGAIHPDDPIDDIAFADRRGTVPLLPGCRHTFITATVTVSGRHPLGLALGDLLVRTESAGGRCRERTIPVDADSVVHLGGLTHFDLLDHPLVYDVISSALTRKEAPAG